MFESSAVCFMSAPVTHCRVSWPHTLLHWLLTQGVEVGRKLRTVIVHAVAVRRKHAVNSLQMCMQVPCVAVVENMSFFDGEDGRRYTPFGAGSGDRIQREFGLPHLIRFPIAEDISQAGDGGRAALWLPPSCVLQCQFLPGTPCCSIRVLAACCHQPKRCSPAEIVQ